MTNDHTGSMLRYPFDMRVEVTIEGKRVMLIPASGHELSMDNNGVLTLDQINSISKFAEFFNAEAVVWE